MLDHVAYLMDGEHAPRQRTFDELLDMHNVGQTVSEEQHNVSGMALIIAVARICAYQILAHKVRSFPSIGVNSL